MLRTRSRRLEASRGAHNKALHYLARAREYRLSDLVKYQLIQVAEAYTGRCNEAAARAGIEWMREQARKQGERPTF
jgi:hypothetical protein